MKQTNSVFLIAILVFTGCTSAYRIGQTPDDVYFSPAKYAATSEEKEQKIKKQEREEYTSWVEDRNDAFLRMRIQNRNRWNSLDDFSYWNDSRFFNNCNCNCYTNNWSKFGNWNNVNFNTGWNNCFSNSWNTWGWNNGNIWGWNNMRPGWGWNNPVWVLSNYKNPAPGGYTAGSNLSAFRNRNFSNNNYTMNLKTNQPYNNNNNNNSNLGGLLKRVFSSSGNNSNGWDVPTRSFSSGSSSTSSSAGGNSGGTKSSSTTNSSAGGRGGRGGQ